MRWIISRRAVGIALIACLASCHSDFKKTSLTDNDIVDKYYCYLWSSSDSAQIDLFQDSIAIGTKPGSRSVKGVMVDGSEFSVLSKTAIASFKMQPDVNCDGNINAEQLIKIRLFRNGHSIGEIDCYDGVFRFPNTCDKRVVYETTEFVELVSKKISNWQKEHPESVSEQLWYPSQ